MAELNETQRYFIEEHIEDYRDGHITRRELVRRVTLIAGGAAAAATILAACDLSKIFVGPDPAHLFLGGYDPLEFFRKYRPHIVYMHDAAQIPELQISPTAHE